MLALVFVLMFLAERFLTPAPGWAKGRDYAAELYYAWQVNEQLEVTPDLQWITRPGADGAAEDVTVVGLRATMRL